MCEGIPIYTNRALIDQMLTFDIGPFQILTFDINFEILTLTLGFFLILTLTALQRRVINILTFGIRVFEIWTCWPSPSMPYECLIYSTQRG